LDSDEHVAGLGEVGFSAKRAVPPVIFVSLLTSARTSRSRQSCH
jgi:hypothetical protein